METATETKNRGGRPSRFDPEFVLDIAEQVLIEFYNRNQNLLRTRIRHDPDFTSKIRSKAHFLAVIVRTWLDVLEHVPSKHPNFRGEAAFWFWCSRLEPPQPPEVLAKKPHRERELRDHYMKYCTAEHWRLNCKRWVEAIRRVREDRTVELEIPPTISQEDEDEDDFL